MKVRRIFCLFLVLTFIILSIFSIPASAAGAGGQVPSEYISSFEDCSIYSMYSSDGSTYRPFTYSCSAYQDVYLILVLDFNSTIKSNSFVDLIIDFKSSNFYDNIVLDSAEFRQASSSVTGGISSSYSGIVSGQSFIFSDILLDHDVNSAFIKFKVSGLTTTLFHFELSDVNVDDSSDTLLGRISRVVRNIWNSIVELPERIVYHLKGGLQTLFVPTESDLTELKDKFAALLDDRFGAVYDSTQIISDFSNTFVSQSQSAMISGEGSDGSVSFPSVTVNLAGSDFTFGGFDVDLFPAKFSALVDVLKIITNIVCTLLFINSLKKRLMEVLHDN